MSIDDLLFKQWQLPILKSIRRHIQHTEHIDKNEALMQAIKYHGSELRQRYETQRNEEFMTCNYR